MKKYYTKFLLNEPEPKQSETANIAALIYILKEHIHKSGYISPFTIFFYLTVRITARYTSYIAILPAHILRSEQLLALSIFSILFYIFLCAFGFLLFIISLPSYFCALVCTIRREKVM